MCGGGGSYDPPPDNSLEVARLEREERDQNRTREEEREAKEKSERAARYSSGLAQATESTRNRARREFSNRGLNYDDYASIVEAEIADRTATVPQDDQNPGQYFGEDLVDSILNDVQDTSRRNYKQQVNSTFADNFANSLYGDTADDQYISSILSGQRETATSALNTARARGNLTDTGYQRALEELERQTSAANSTAQSLGQSVIQGYRDRASDIGERAETAASSYELGNSFDTSSYQDELSNLTNTFTNNLQGDVTSALSGQTFYDLSDILSRAGTAQGPSNPTISTADSIAERERLRNSRRGVGGSGTF